MPPVLSVAREVKSVYRAENGESKTLSLLRELICKPSRVLPTHATSILCGTCREETIPSTRANGVPCIVPASSVRSTASALWPSRFLHAARSTTSATRTGSLVGSTYRLADSAIHRLSKSPHPPGCVSRTVDAKPSTFGACLGCLLLQTLTFKYKRFALEHWA